MNVVDNVSSSASSSSSSASSLVVESPELDWRKECDMYTGSIYVDEYRKMLLEMSCKMFQECPKGKMTKKTEEFWIWKLCNYLTVNFGTWKDMESLK